MAQNKKYAVRFHLHNGEKMAMACKASFLFSHIKDQIWAKKNFPMGIKNDFVFKMNNGEFHFHDYEEFSRLLELLPVFVESDSKGNLIEVVVIAKNDIGDAHRRATKTPAIGAVMAEGSASKMGGGPLFRFKKCYLVLQSSTLFIFENKETYEARKPALEWIPMGNVLLDTDPESEFNKKSKEFAFTFKECSSDLSVTLGCPTAEEQQYWLKALGACNARRVKLIVVTCVEEMLSRGVDVEGIFRVSGSKQVIEAIKRDYDAGKPVDVTSVKDIHALSGLLKLCVRELYEPLFTWDNYSDFVTLGGLGAEATADQIREVMAKLPMSNQGLLRYMFRFLWRVAQHEKTNLMGYKNLAIVFAPNLLRPKVESVESTVMDQRNVLAIVTRCVELQEQIWPADEADHFKALRLNSQPPRASGMVPPPPPSYGVPQGGMVPPPPPGRGGSGIIVGGRPSMGSQGSGPLSVGASVADRMRLFANSGGAPPLGPPPGPASGVFTAGPPPPPPSKPDHALLAEAKQTCDAAVQQLQALLLHNQQQLHAAFQQAGKALNGDEPTGPAWSSVQKGLSSLGDTQSALANLSAEFEGVRTALGQLGGTSGVRTRGSGSKSKKSKRKKDKKAAGGHIVKILYDHEGDVNDGEIAVLKKGDLITVLDATDPDGWWVGVQQRTGEQGIFPSNFCKAVST